jgi:7,8-dihydro-6-hydroxymethylpterin-pyrophosphokinase
MTTKTVYIGLGSNLPSIAGDPKATLIAAIARLGSLGGVTAQSSFYETAAIELKRKRKVHAPSISTCCSWTASFSTTIG